MTEQTKMTEQPQKIGKINWEGVDASYRRDMKNRDRTIRQLRMIADECKDDLADLKNENFELMEKYRALLKEVADHESKEDEFIALEKKYDKLEEYYEECMCDEREALEEDIADMKTHHNDLCDDVFNLIDDPKSGIDEKLYQSIHKLVEGSMYANE